MRRKLLELTAMDDNDDPREEIARLERRIEALAGRIENCRKIALVSRIAIALGAILLAAMMLGLLRFDAIVMAASLAAAIGGFVLLGSNSSTAKEAAVQIAEAEAARAALIGGIELRVVGDPDTVH
jgi:hypothetical protein